MPVEMDPMMTKYIKRGAPPQTLDKRSAGGISGQEAAGKPAASPSQLERTGSRFSQRIDLVLSMPLW
jgi:hypothetical protein